MTLAAVKFTYFNGYQMNSNNSTWINNPPQKWKQYRLNEYNNNKMF
jgi:hypothetical protein